MAKAGDLDKSFGNQGLLVTNFPITGTGISNTNIYSLEQDSNKNIIAAGTIFLDDLQKYCFALTKYDKYGFIDVSFGLNGLVKTQFSSNSSDKIYSIALDNENNIICGGVTTVNNDSKFALSKYNKQGYLDENFGLNGLVITDMVVSDNEETINSIKIDKDNNIVVGGIVGSLGNLTDSTYVNYYHFAVARYKSNGMLDTSFGDNGKIISFMNNINSNEQCIINSIAINKDNKIICGGVYVNDTKVNQNIVVICYNSNGTLDTSFGNNGIKMIDLYDNSYDTLNTICLDNFNRILCGCSSKNTNEQDCIIISRLTDKGELDSTFGNNGFVVTPLSGYKSINILKIDTIKIYTTNQQGQKVLDKEKIICCGYDQTSIGSTLQQFLLACYTSSGELDNTFGTNGIVHTQFSKDSTNLAFNLIVQPEDNKIIVAGQNYYSISGKFIGGFALARYYGVDEVVSNTPICFPKGTPVLTDQGECCIDEIDINKHTIRGNNIVAITKSIPLQNHIICIEKHSLSQNVPSKTTYISMNHELFYKGKMIKAIDLVGKVEGVYKKKYDKQVLYNVLLEKHDKMIVNNMIVETLNPENILAKLYSAEFSEKYRNEMIVRINKALLENNTNEYIKISKYLM